MEAEKTLTNEEIIRELLDLLKKNTMKEQANDVFEICTYVDGLEKKIVSMTEELTSMQDQIKKMQEDTLINNAKKALTEAQERLNARCEQIKSQVSEIKVQVKSTAKNIVDETKAKGRAALYRVTEFVGIKKRLLNVRTAVKDMIVSTDRDIARIALLAKGLREAGQIVNNAFHTFADKPEVDYSQKEQKHPFTKAVLAPMKAVKKLLVSMELHLDASIDKLDNLAMNVQFDKEKRMEQTKDKEQKAPDTEREIIYSPMVAEPQEYKYNAGYDSDSLIESMKEQHEQAVKSFEEYLEKIRPTMITKEGTACMDAIDKAWAEYKEVDAKVIEVGATTDTAKSLQAQQMMTDEAAPKYQALDDALQKLMALNISLGNAKRAQLRTVMIAALTIIIIVIAVSTIYSNSLSVAISKSIEKPLNELKDRFITFAEGDIDSPLPTVESEDEIKELVSGVSAMSDRIRVIIKDSGRMLNEMSEGNFAIDTECEEVYTGAFTDLLTGIRKMNEEIDTTVRGVDDASGQVLTGSTNLAEAAQSLAEGATDQAASVEEMQATINELTSGIKTTAEELGTAYDEAYKYAEIAEGSRGDMEVLVQAMSRINETSEKIGAIITQIEDIASQTNLLSLNASIEAARAGEAGKGFAVVADQIRNLAEQSAKSAVDSKALIEAAIHEVGDGNMYAEKASTSLREVVDGIQAIADSAKKIKEISIEQADSMEQVEATAERIAEVVQNNSAAAQETSATSEELTAQATTLSGMVSVFKLRQ